MKIEKNLAYHIGWITIELIREVFISIIFFTYCNLSPGWHRLIYKIFIFRFSIDSEYAYKCDSCDRMYGVAPRECCRRPLKKIIYDDLYENDLTAFICNLCNFLQIDEKSVQKHLRNEHENVADNQYHEILLLPSSKNLSKYCI